MLTLLVPVAALASLHAGIARRDAGRMARAVAVLAGGLGMVATVHLARYGWLGLRTWAL